MRKIYLDYAAAAPLDPKVLKTMEPYFADEFYNPSATYLDAKKTRQAVETARKDIAGIIGSQASEIIFTAGATEANNLAIQGVMRRFPKAELLISSTEHDSVLEPAKLSRHKLVPVDGQGIVSVDSLAGLISDQTVLVSIILINNETGALQPIKDIFRLLESVRKKRKAEGSVLPLYLHTDAAQAPSYLDLHSVRLQVDMMSINGGKIYGPKQTGFLFVRTSVELKPLILGGGQERGLRAGTENVAGVVGLAAALKLAVEGRVQETARVKALNELFREGLAAHIPTAAVNGSLKHRSPHILSITFAGYDNERLMMELDEAGVKAAVGSACSASSEEPSRVLAAMGLPAELIRSTLRFSFGKSTTKQNIRDTVQVLSKLTS
ncbi:MAG: cysteine desulfurase family protein [Candidatus Saccharimonadales bacterium]